MSVCVAPYIWKPLFSLHQQICNPPFKTLFEHISFMDMCVFSYFALFLKRFEAVHNKTQEDDPIASVKSEASEESKTEVKVKQSQEQV